jgi:pyridoxamine 5'-phosphate oxidase
MDEPEINALNFSLTEILNDCWQQLSAGVKSSKHPFHHAVIGTINEGFADTRTVILRKVIAEKQCLIFHSDARSPKINQLKKNNKVSWLFYDEPSRIQIRIKAEALIHHQNEVALERWNASRLESRRCYLANPAPSSISEIATDGLPKNLTVKDLTEENVACGFDNFVVVETKVLELEWLFLNHAAHKRANFSYHPKTNKINQHWLIP